MDILGEELVEWVAAKCWLSHINHARLTNKSIPEGLDETDFRKQLHINHAMFEDLAKQILDHMTKNGWVQLDPDQSLPECGCSNYMLLGDEGRREADYKVQQIKEIQRDMVNRRWRKVKEAQDEMS